MESRIVFRIQYIVISTVIFLFVYGQQSSIPTVSRPLTQLTFPHDLPPETPRPFQDIKEISQPMYLYEYYFTVVCVTWLQSTDQTIT